MVKKETSNILIFSAPDSYLIGEPSICSRRAAQRRKMEESASHHVTERAAGAGDAHGPATRSLNSQRVDLRIMLDFGKLGTPIS